MTKILSHLASMYVGAGLFGALLMAQAIPAINLFGIAYMTATWPRLIYCTPVERGCDPMPPEWLGVYMFSFGDQP
jgi:hypothetical protein